MSAALPTFTNLGTTALLEQMLDVLAGELGGAGGGQVAQAREHARAALSQPEGTRGPALGRIRAALERAEQERPETAHRSRSVDVIELRPALEGAALTLSDGVRVMVPRSLLLFLMLPPGLKGRAWLTARAGTPQAVTYILPPHLILSAAEALGFELEPVAEALAESG